MFSTHITTTTARDTRSVLLAEPDWRFARRRAQGVQTATTPQATSQTGTPAADTDNLRHFQPRPTGAPVPAPHGRAARSITALRQSSRIAMPLAVTAIAVALTASVDTIARVVLNAL